MIKAAKRGTNSSDHIDFDQELKTAKTLVKEFGSGQQGMIEVVANLDLDSTKSLEEQKRRAEVYASVSKGLTVTRRFVDE